MKFMKQSMIFLISIVIVSILVLIILFQQAQFYNKFIKDARNFAKNNI
jgi:hypothetical protein